MKGLLTMNSKEQDLLNTFPKFDDFLNAELQDNEMRTIWVNDALKEYSDTKDVNQLVLRLKPLIEKDYTICEFAKKTGIHRVTLYKIFSYKIIPSVDVLNKIFSALGYNLTLSIA